MWIFLKILVVNIDDFKQDQFFRFDSHMLRAKYWRISRYVISLL